MLNVAMLNKKPRELQFVIELPKEPSQAQQATDVVSSVVGNVNEPSADKKDT
jgi:hypothetical protein